MQSGTDTDCGFALPSISSLFCPARIVRIRDASQEGGNVVLAGHRDTFFRPLRDIQLGDTVLLRTHTGDVDYVVESTAVVAATDLEVLQPAGGRTLTLITCVPFSFVGSAPDRFIVRAREVIGGQ